MKRIALLGDFQPDSELHAATTGAIAHARQDLGLDVHAEWIATQAANSAMLAQFSGIWVAPGSPYRNMQNVLAAIEHARKHGIPCLGTCGGFQHMILEYARNVLQFADAQHAEYDPNASRLFISRLSCSLVGRKMQLRFAAGSQAANIYGKLQATENYYCNFGVNPDYVGMLTGGPLVVSGSDAEGEVRVIELPGHPFFVGTLFVPQARSTAAAPHPLVSAFLSSIARR
jgi:CTP synthase (UTP-ammonia lyase)